MLKWGKSLVVSPFFPTFAPRKENINNLRDAALYYIETNAKMLDEIADKIISL